VQLTLFNVTGAINDTATWNVTPSAYKIKKDGQIIGLVKAHRGTVILFQ
jgi:hypothetical protein